MKLSEILQGTDAEVLSGDDVEILHIAIDSRRVKQGALFICLVGQLDGHDFIANAVKNGAAAVLVMRQSNIDGISATVASCECTRQVYAQACANFYKHPARDMKLIGVTGTNGKTTTCWLIYAMLHHLGHNVGLIGTLGAYMAWQKMPHEISTSTTPDPHELHCILRQMHSNGARTVVLEVSSHALHLKKLYGLKFDIGVYTNLTQDHLDFHGTMENYARAKAQLFKQSRRAVINIDCPYSDTMSEGHSNAASYAIDRAASLVAKNIAQGSAIEGASFDAVFMDIEIGRFNMNMAGRFNVYNALAAMLTLLPLRLLSHSISADKIRAALAAAPSVPGRIQAVKNSQGYGVFVDYAHTPDGLQNIIDAIRPITRGRLITLFGCGGDRDATKRAPMGKIAAELSDHVIITSDNPRYENPEAIIADICAGVRQIGKPFETITSRADAIQKGVGMLTFGDSLIIAGKGHEDYQIVGGKKQPFDDYKEAQNALDRL